MSISKLFEQIRDIQGRHKVLAYLFNWILTLISLGGFWILIQYGADDDRYFAIGIAMIILAFLGMLPIMVRHD